MVRVGKTARMELLQVDGETVDALSIKILEHISASLIAKKR